MSETVFITGATSGIGKATAYLFAEKKYRLVICGRREDRLQEIARELSAKTEVHYLCFDVRNYQSVNTSIASLPSDFSKITILINNAGNAHGLAPIHEGEVADWDSMIDINVKGLLYVTKALVPNMIVAKNGHIVNVGSIAGKEVYPNGNVYNASKFAVEALGKGMLMDLNPYGIRVSNINPGLVATEFSLVRFKGDAHRADNVYKGYQPLTAEDIAETIYWIVSRPPHINISDLTILPTAQASATIVNKKAN